jgi:hypothetical protein
MYDKRAELTLKEGDDLDEALVSRLSLPRLDDDCVVWVRGCVLRVRIQLVMLIGMLRSDGRAPLTRITLSSGRLRYERSFTGPSLPMRVASRNNLYEMK